MNLKKLKLDKLEKEAAIDPTNSSQVMTIRELCLKIEKKEITIPMYQRSLTWNNQKAIDLFNYQLSGKAPVSPLSFTKIDDNNNVPQLSLIDREIIDNKDKKEAYSVIDGQQRLTANYKAFSNHDDLRNVVLDLSRGKFIKSENIKMNQIPVGILLNKDQRKLSEYVETHLFKNSSTILSTLLAVRQKIVAYRYTLHIAGDMNEDEQIKWFEVLNNAGTKISQADLAITHLKLHDFDMYNDYINKYLYKIEKYGFEKYFEKFSVKVTYPMASLNPALECVIHNKQHKINFAPITQDQKIKKLEKLDRNALKEISEVTLDNLEFVLKFIEKNNLNSFIDNMKYILFMTGYFIFVDTKNIKEKELIQWVKNVNFYKKSVEDQRNIYDKLINNVF